MSANSEWYEKDYYSILGVDKSASEKDIRNAYRKLAKAYHPDAHPGSEEKFKELSSAYEVLGDAKRRSEYDSFKDQSPFMPRTGGGGGGSEPGFNFKVEDLGDVFGGLFNKGRRNPTAGPQRGSDVDTSLSITFIESIEGLTTSVNVIGEAQCRTCHGTGAAPGSSPVVCARCQGSGSVNENQGFFSFSQPCPACGGRGLRVDLPCNSCQGTGTVPSNRKLNVRIPAGVEDGQRIRLKQKGGPGRNGGPSGDLYITIKVGADPRFSRRGNDLVTTSKISFPQATLGTDIVVPTLRSSVKLRVPAGTKSGQVLRAKGYGVAPSGRRITPGDLLVTIEIVIPKNLSDEQRKLVEELARILPKEV
ncbi:MULTISPECIES: molecular chaperone DnaJ [Acidithrix]|uniref:Chaperone protein DnaJ n=1 Tax=Acidithrix ferrooxidans TaxID=1280514 RepID=A0A0D8HJ58_9ACTN|nr:MULTISPECIES: molecular chaperone DnaJ [Acidithrix]KJF17889.1 chaperone protein DnaJ [Acidithrix ferrooxidans]CAG4934090.1 unnamed protein product [Acidithrix sp. C25]